VAVFVLRSLGEGVAVSSLELAGGGRGVSGSRFKVQSSKFKGTQCNISLLFQLKASETKPNSHIRIWNLEFGIYTGKFKDICSK
jgi:hypothetical protein